MTTETTMIVVAIETAESMGWVTVPLTYKATGYTSAPESEVYSDKGLDTLVRAGLNYLMTKLGMTEEYFLLSAAAFGGNKEKNALGWWLLHHQYEWESKGGAFKFAAHLAYVVAYRHESGFQDGYKGDGGLRHPVTGEPNLKVEYDRFHANVEDDAAWQAALRRARR